MAQKPPKLDRQTKKNISQVIGKYVDRQNNYMLPAVYAGAGTLSLAALAVDVMGAGGLATLSLQSLGIPAAFTLGGGVVLYSMRTRERKKSNGQTIIASEIVYDTLDKMEARLRQAFAKASQPNASKLAKSELQFVLDDVEADLKTLAPVYKVIGGEDYIFIVETRRPYYGTQEPISLQRKLAEMRAAQEEVIAPAAKEEKTTADKPAHDETPKPRKRSGGFDL